MFVLDYSGTPDADYHCTAYGWAGSIALWFTIPGALRIYPLIDRCFEGSLPTNVEVGLMQ